MAVIYEWDVEELEEAPSELNGFDPDIVDHTFCDSYRQAVETLKMFQTVFEVPARIVLVRDVGNANEGITDRSWAYLNEDGTMPIYFEYGAGEQSLIPVPKRFHDEVARG